MKIADPVLKRREWRKGKEMEDSDLRTLGLCGIYR
jgi:hypothetical protein